MSTRQEEKEQRKQERLAREAAAAAAAKRKRLLQLIGGVVVACAIVAGVAYAVTSGGGGGEDGVDDDKLTAAATAAGCVYRAFPNEGQEHTAEEVTAPDFKTNPPTSGPHSPNPAPDGIYVPGNEPAIGNWVHTLEHGRVIIQYKPRTAANVVQQLTALFNEDVADSGGAHHSVLMQNNSAMKPQVAAVAWRHYVVCDEFTPQVIDAFRAFREELVDKAPEQVP